MRLFQLSGSGGGAVFYTMFVWVVVVWVMVVMSFILTSYGDEFH